MILCVGSNVGPSTQPQIRHKQINDEVSPLPESGCRQDPQVTLGLLRSQSAAHNNLKSDIKYDGLEACDVSGR